VIDEVVIRKAGEEDAEAITRVQIRTWQTAYTGLFPADKLETLDENFGKRSEFWREQISGSEAPLITYVAEAAGELVGFAGGSAERSGEWPYDGELNVIYVLDEYQKRGIGRRLVGAVAQALLDQDLHSMIVWVLADSPYRVFYEALGGEYVGEQGHEVWGKTYQVAGYGWARIEDLLT
jgi:GNAT superfamily N-acetyltransferase